MQRIDTTQRSRDHVRMVDVVTVGETMAALWADRPVRLGGALRLSIAGAESTVAIGLARLGHAVRWVGVVGADELGELIRRTLRAENVDVSCVRTEPDAPTGLVLFEPRLADITRVQYFRSHSAGSRLSVEDIAPAVAERPRVLHLTGITPALGPGPRAAAARAAAVAREQDAVVCLDVNYRSRLWSPSQARDTLADLVPYATIVIASDGELDLVGSAGDLLDRGVREVVVKRGAAGALVHTTDGTATVHARQVPVVNTIGAGDAFVAGYLSGFLDQLSIPDRLHRAVTVAAFAVSSADDWSGLPTRSELTLADLDPGTAIR